MPVRKSAAALTDGEIIAFLEAILRLKAKPAPGLSDISLYDQFVALHGAVMGIMTPTSGSATVNFAHGTIGFLPWHRQYLRAFEAALADEVPGVAIPYWDWADDIGAVTRIFTPEFLSSHNWGIPLQVTDGVLQFFIPTSQRPAWWPNGVSGFRVNQLLEEGQGATLRRGSTDSSWPPDRPWLRALIELELSVGGQHANWAFWLIL